MTSPTVGTPTSGVNAANSTSISITLPTYSYPSDYLLLFVCRNQTDANAMTGDANATVAELANSGTRRMTALKVTPANGSITSFTLSQTTNCLTGWVCMAVSNADAAHVVGKDGPSQGDTTSALSFSNIPLTWTTDGTELVIGCGGVNSTATWTTDGNTVFNTTSGNTALMVEKGTPTAGQSSVPFANLDRGNNGSARTEASVAVFFTNAITNYLVGGGFEEGSTLATGWTEEHTTGSAATYSLSTTTGLQQGIKAQRMQFSGGTGVLDKVEFYQAVDNVFTTGNSCTFSVYLSGSITNAYYQIVIEAHHIGTGYISEVNLPILSLTGTPTLYSVTFNNLPSTTDRVVCVVSANELTSATVDLYADQSTLIAAAGGLPFFMQYNLIAGGLQTLNGGFQ